MNNAKTFVYMLVGLMLARPLGAATVSAVFNSASDVPVSAAGYIATGNTVSFTLNFAPSVGTELMVVNNTALPFISGAVLTVCLPVPAETKALDTAA